MAVLRYVLMGALTALTAAGIFWPVFEIPVVGQWIPMLSALGIVGVWLWGRAKRPPRYYAGYGREYRRLRRSTDLVPMIVRTSRQAGGGRGWTRWAVTVMPSSQLSLKPSTQLRFRAVIDTPDDEPPLNGETWLCAVSEKYPELVVPIRRDANTPLESVKRPNSRVVELSTSPHATTSTAVTLVAGALLVGTLFTGGVVAATGERFGQNHNTQDAPGVQSTTLTPEVINDKVAKLIEASGTSTFGALTVSAGAISAEVLATPGGRQVDSVRLGFKDAFTREGYRTLSKDEAWREFDFANFDARAFSGGLNRGLELTKLPAGRVDSATYEVSKINGKSLVGRFTVRTDYGYGGVDVRDDGRVLSAFLPGGELPVLSTLLAPETRDKAWSNLAGALAGMAVSRVNLGADAFTATIPGDVKVNCDDIGCDTSEGSGGGSGLGEVSDEVSDAFSLAKVPWENYSSEELLYATIVISEGTFEVRVSVPEQPERSDTYGFDGKPVTP